MRNPLLSSIAILLALAPRLCAAQDQPPQFRLPTFAAPVHYSINLTVIPDKDTFTGTVDIDLNYKEASSVLWLNAEKITVKSGTLTFGGRTLTAKVISEAKDLICCSFHSAVSPGPAKFHAEYQGLISPKDIQRVFQCNDGDHS